MSSVSRRSFVTLSALASASLVLPQVSSATAQNNQPARSDKIHLNFNESHLGPSHLALEKMQDGAASTGRYHYGAQLKLIELFARQNRIPSDYVHAYSGSREPLQYAIAAFTDEHRGLALATPSYDAPVEAAHSQNVTIHEVPLRPDGSHDLDAMLKADRTPGLIYICNPNNPTGTVTAQQQIEQAILGKPEGTVVLIDEAYIHFSDAPSLVPLAATRKDVLVLRTFSKLYGMAGARLGFAIGHPELLEKIEVWGGNNFVPLPAAMGGIASLEDPDLVRQRKLLNGKVREQTRSFLASHGFTCTASQANCFMIDTGHPAERVIEGLARRGILIGRKWDVWPTWVRVSIGTEAEMQTFREAFLEVVQQLA
ncbi:putative aminotransferase [Pseudomonas cichorii]|uniref:Putative aminotransferase n=1 Tax=Pseudomonas cichorii TaxID=36746 RepID=A0A3M4LWE7_PSECI|nr:pyridoxal phosphate-dependent aminotransferase [Pseudomonas cichorii]RMQ45730.1 putative aminotransferase [Pseudomonas cichorii]